MISIHSANVLHRDLKPSNILLNSNCDLKICDFGLARGAKPDDHAGFLTAYVATRWYRAPEIMLSWREYTNAVDLWSVGCIFAEIIGRRPLFPGKDYIDQLKRVIEIIGSPSSDDLENIVSERTRKFVASLPYKERIPFTMRFPKASPLAADLLERMLVFDPARRISVADALEHPYLASLHDPSDEPICPTEFYFEFEPAELTKEDLRRLIYEEVLLYHPELENESMMR